MTAVEFAKLIKLARRRSGSPWWDGCCPSHQDRRPSLSWRDGDRGLVVECRAGCAFEQIAAALGREPAEFFRGQQGRPPLTLEAFAQAKGLPVEFLREHGVREDGDSLVITYRLRDGSLAPRQRRRYALAAKDGSAWDGPKGVAPVAYGLWKLDDTFEKGELLLVEGETDTLTGWLHNIPTLGLPGADTAKLLTTEILTAIDRVDVLQEPDRGGETFIRGIAVQLERLGFTGRAFALRLPVKDLNELHLTAGDRFADEVQKARAAAVPLAEAASAERATGEAQEPAVPLGVGGGAFLRLSFPAPNPLIEGLLSDEGGGWRGGEEKLGKSIEVLEEVICLVFGLPVLGRFAVPTPRRVLLVSEEDSPRRTWRRLRALLRGHGLDPDDPAVQATLDDRLRISAWEGFQFDDRGMVARLEATLAEFRPEVVYLDVLRKLTAKDLNKADQASAILDVLDDFRRRYGCVFIVVHHYRKTQGFRVGRGSQEIGGSFVLGAWGENSLFFEPIGRKQGAVRVEVQTKDGPPVPGFKLVIEAEGPEHDPVWLRLRAEDDQGDDLEELVYQAIATLPKTEALVGKPGVTLEAIAAAVKRAPRTVRRPIKSLEESGRIVAIGQVAKQKLLYAVKEQ